MAKNCQPSLEGASDRGVPTLPGDQATEQSMAKGTTHKGLPPKTAWELSKRLDRALTASRQVEFLLGLLKDGDPRIWGMPARLEDVAEDCRYTLEMAVSHTDMDLHQWGLWDRAVCLQRHAGSLSRVLVRFPRDSMEHWRDVRYVLKDLACAITSNVRSSRTMLGLD